MVDLKYPSEVSFVGAGRLEGVWTVGVLHSPLS